MALVSGPSLAAVLFTDLVGSTVLRTALGEERADELRKLHDRLLTERIEAHHGRVIKGLGDGLMAAFHSASDALSAGVEAQQALFAHNQRSDAIAELSVRMGCSVGDVSWDEGECFGTPVVEAARLVAVAVGGQIVCSDFVRVMSCGRGGHRFRSLGAMELKGLPEPLSTCEVQWDPPARQESQRLGFPHQLVVRSPWAFVGRDEELAAAERHLGGCDGLAVLWLVGEPGIGKTRLAAELGCRAHAAGTDVLFGRCDEELQAPFQPFVSALRQFITTPPAEDILARLGRHPAELARLLPELSTHVPDVQPLLPADPEMERYRLFEAVRSWLVATAERRPLLLVLDDLQWAARPTLQLLAYLGRSADRVPLRIVGTLRDTEPSGGELQALIDELAARPEFRTINMRGLAMNGVTRLVEAATGRSGAWDDRGLAAQIHAETAGNPLFIGAVLSGLESGGVPDRLPPDVVSAVRRRVTRLSPVSRDLLRVAAVVGLTFELPLVTRVLDTAASAVLGAVDEATAAHLAEETGAGRYRFSHALVRSVLRHELGESRAAHYHGLIGMALEDLHRGRLDDHLEELAHHFGAAAAGGGSVDQALRYLLGAAERSASQYAAETAALRYRRAVELIEASGRSAERQCCEVLVALGRAQWQAAQFEGARTTLRRAASAAEAGGWTDLLAEAATLFGYACTFPGLVGDEAVGLLSRAVCALGSADSPLRAAVLAGLGAALSHTERAGESGRVIDEAIAMARRVGDEPALGLALKTVYIAVRGPAHARRRLEAATEAQQVARRIGDRWLEVMAATERHAVLLELGRGPDLHSAFEEVEKLQVELADPFIAYAQANMSSTLALLEGRLDEAERCATRALTAGRGLAGVDAEGVYGLQMFSLRREQGRVHEVASAVRALARGGPPSSTWGPGLAAVYAELGMAEEAREQLEALVTAHELLLPADGRLPLSLSYLTDAAAMVGDGERAEVLYRHLEPHAEVCVVVHHVACYGPASRFLGMLAATAGRFDDAENHFDDALQRCQGMGSPTWMAHAQYQFARLLLIRRRRCDLSQGLVLARAAHATASRIGMSALAARAGRVLELSADGAG